MILMKETTNQYIVYTFIDTFLLVVQQLVLLRFILNFWLLTYIYRESNMTQIHIYDLS